MRAMDSRRDFTSKKVFSGYFSELGEKANSALPSISAGRGPLVVPLLMADPLEKQSETIFY